MMRALAHPVVQFWIIASLVSLVCQIVLWRKGLALRYWGLALFLALEFGRSAVIFVAMIGWNKYYEAWMITKPIDMLALLILAGHAIYRVGEHYQMPASIVALPAMVTGGASAIVAAWTCGLGIGRWLTPAAQRATIWTRQEALVLMLTLAAVAGLLSLFRIVQMRRNVQWLVVITVGYLAGSYACMAWLTAASQGRQRLPQIVMQVVSAAACIAWAAGLTRGGEHWVPPRPDPNDPTAGEEQETRIANAIRQAAGK